MINVLKLASRLQLLCAATAADDVLDGARCYTSKPTDVATTTKPHRSDGVAAQLVISVPVISWASRAPNPRRRTVCVAPSAQQFQSPPAHSTAVDRDHPRRSKTLWPDVGLVAPGDHCHSQHHGYNYGRSWYDGLDQLD